MLEQSNYKMSMLLFRISLAPKFGVFMSKEGEYRIILFISMIASVYLFAFFSIIRLFLGKFGYIKPSNQPWKLWLSRASLLAALLGVICLIYGFIEPYWLSVSYIRIETSKLPNNTKPLKIIHFSDLHSDPIIRLEEKIPEFISKEQPDLIVYTGDTINSPEGLIVAREFFTKLAKIAPTYVVKGNWDSWYWDDLNLFGQTGVKELKANSEKVTINNFSFWITGIAVGKVSKLPKLLSKIPNNEFSIFLYHYPDEIEDIAGQKVDLYCAGHTHGGQIAIPFYGALTTLSKFDKKYESGLYKVKDTWLYVNRGIGMEGGDVPRVRFCARPEITVIEVYPKNTK